MNFERRLEQYFMLSLSRPSSQQIPLPVMEARRDNKKER